VHSERAGDDLHEHSHLHGIQSWMALPLEEEECDPAFVHYPAADIPGLRIGAAEVRVVIGTAWGLASPVQVAAPMLIESGALVRAQILDRVRANYRALRTAVARHPAIEVLHADAGWSAVLRVPSTRSEEDLVVDLLDRDGVLVHPGFFFDFAHEAFIIVSLLPEPQVFADGIRRVLERADA